jgi:hypothetical protein
VNQWESKGSATKSAWQQPTPFRQTKVVFFVVPFDVLLFPLTQSNDTSLQHEKQ